MKQLKVNKRYGVLGKQYNLADRIRKL